MERLKLRCGLCGKPLPDASEAAVAWFTRWSLSDDMTPVSKPPVEYFRFEHNRCALGEPVTHFSQTYRFGRVLWIVLATPRAFFQYIDQYKWEGVPRERIMDFMGAVMDLSRRELLEQMLLERTVRTLAGGAPAFRAYP